MSSSQKSFLFAAVMCLVVGFGLTFASQSLKERQQANILLDQQKNILKALGLLTDMKMDRDKIKRLYSSKVSNEFVNSSGVLLKEQTSDSDLPIYVVRKDDTVTKYAFPFEAYGLWSWVYGYFALQGDGNTVAGITVYQHGETPGLGGEVEKAWWQNQFVGKKITNSDGEFVSVGVVKGKVSEKYSGEKVQNFVDGISGATITSKGMEKYFEIDVKKYEPFSKKLRERTL
jgi:Na+-transporting NADH:ubiquinone oxidoreductase subunit C